MLRRALITIAVAVALPSTLAAQSPATGTPRDGVMLAFENFAAIFGSRLVAAFDSIPASKYDYKPTPVQQSIGYIAQHLENANYALCNRLGALKHQRSTKDTVADTVKARWPKDTLVARLRASLRFCDTAMQQVAKLESAGNASNLLAFETDLAEHYSQLSVYMRILGLIPPSALPPRPRIAIELPASTLSRYVGLYELAPGQQFDITMQGEGLFIKPTNSGAVRLWPERSNDFFVKEVDAQITFTRDANGTVTGLVLHQYDHDRPARKIR
jgi:hypothetical protein